MTVVEADSVARLLQEPTTWKCLQFVAEGLTVACSRDMSSDLTIDTDGSVRFAVGGSTLAGTIDPGAVFVGAVRADAPWGRIAGSFEDRLCRALTGRLDCEYAGDRLTLRNASAVLIFVPGK